jgi:hypothetical protein
MSVRRAKQEKGAGLVSLDALPDVGKKGIEESKAHQGVSKVRKKASKILAFWLLLAVVVSRRIALELEVHVIIARRIIICNIIIPTGQQGKCQAARERRRRELWWRD